MAARQVADLIAIDVEAVGWRDEELAALDLRPRSEQRLQDHLSKQAHLPFDLEQGPVFRLTFYTRFQQSPILLLAPSKPE